MSQKAPIHIIGGGLAGSEAAWQAAEAGVPVVLHEMRPERSTDAHKTDGLAELVCSNSFRSDEWETNAVGLLHEEMRRAGSLIMSAADVTKLPAGGALAVDRDAFSAEVTRRLAAHPNITIARGEIAGLPPEDWDNVVVASGPLTSPALSAAIAGLTGKTELAFFDAIAPVIHYDSIDQGIVWRASRYGKAGPAGTGADYLNCPMNRDEYEAFIDSDHRLLDCTTVQTTWRMRIVRYIDRHLRDPDLGPGSIAGHFRVSPRYGEVDRERTKLLYGMTCQS